MGKNALVLAGGGSRGSYQVGVWRALRELGWDPDIVTGTSVGALNGALIAQDDYDVAKRMWESIDTGDVLELPQEGAGTGLAQFLAQMARNGGADPRPLEEVLRRCVDEERVRRSPVDFSIVTVEFPTLAPLLLSKDAIPPGQLVDYLMASAACFPAMKMREIGGARYMDGGYYDVMPVNLAIGRGAREIVAVDLEAVGRRRRVKVPAGIKLHHIHSQWDLGAFLKFDPDTARRNMQLGYLDALREFGRLEGQAYAFYKGESLAAQMMAPQFQRMEESLGYSVRKYRETLHDGEPYARVARLGKNRSEGGASAAAVLAAAETAARVFGLSPLETYTLEELNDQILLRAQEHDQETAELAKDWQDLRKPKELLSAFRQIDHRLRTAVCRNEIRRSLEQGSPRPLIPLLARLQAQEFIAGFYLCALEQ